MTVFAGPVLLVALVMTLLTHQVRETMGHTHSDTTSQVPTGTVPVYVPGQALGPSIEVTGRLPPLPPPLVWDARLPFDKGPINITDYNTGKPVFTVQDRNNDHNHCFQVLNLKGDVLVQVHQKSSARKGFSFTYHTPSGVEYRIDPRGALTDRWYMHMQGNDPDVNYQTLTYYRGHKHNIGHVYFKNHTLVASFTFHPPKDSTNLIGSKKSVMLEILAQTNIECQYFIALWALVKLRMGKFGA